MVGHIDRDRLLHENVDALLDGIAEVDPAKARGRGKNGHVARLQAVDRLLVGVQSDELAIVGHVDLMAQLLLQILVTAREPVLEGIGHGHELDRTVLHRQGVGRGAGAPAAATDQRNLNRVVLRGVDVRDGDRRQGRGRGDPPALL